MVRESPLVRRWRAIEPNPMRIGWPQWDEWCRRNGVPVNVQCYYSAGNWPLFNYPIPNDATCERFREMRESRQEIGPLPLWNDGDPMPWCETYLCWVYVISQSVLDFNVQSGCWRAIEDHPPYTFDRAQHVENFRANRLNYPSVADEVALAARHTRKGLVSVHEAAGHCNTATKTIERALRAGQLERHNFRDGSIRIDLAAVERWNRKRLKETAQ